SPTYPSALGECGQAVKAAQLATAAGTVVYTIGFGSETTGCTTDETYTTTASSTDGAEAWPKHLLFRQFRRLPGALPREREFHEPGADFPSDRERPEHSAHDSQWDDVRRLPTGKEEMLQ
ncbi:MAG: hypothetical protein ABSE36_17340, partial [Terracidiphilus sp.]